MLTKIYSDLEQNNAKIYLIDFIAAATTFKEPDCDNFGVFLSMDKIQGIQKLKYVLMHECGHCATGALHKLSSPYEIVGKNEEKANRWAYERYLPFETLAQAIKAGYTETWQLSDYFDLDEEFIKKAMYYYFEVKQRKVG